MEGMKKKKKFITKKERSEGKIETVLVEKETMWKLIVFGQLKMFMRGSRW